MSTATATNLEALFSPQRDDLASHFWQLRETQFQPVSKVSSKPSIFKALLQNTDVFPLTTSRLQ